MIAHCTCFNLLFGSLFLWNPSLLFSILLNSQEVPEQSAQVWWQTMEHPQ